ncbi:MAG: ROK family protein [Burkholderiales bacterium]|nr:ROK family protein [Burkholderiales bacterium]
MRRIGVDLGGTKIEAIALDETGRALSRQRVATPRDDYAGTLDAVATLVAAIEREAGTCDTVGIGTPGAVSARTGRMKNCNSTWLNGRPLAQDLEAALGRPVRIANDANCFALSEAVDGAGRGARIVFGVILGTGVGGGIVVDGRVLEGANAIAGEWGHNPLPGPREEERPGPACYCGRTGCIETWLSGPGLAADHVRETGERLTAEQIAARASPADAACSATLARYEDRLARALAHVINVLDPHVVVLGGGLANVERLYDNVPRLWARHVFSDDVATRLVRNVHGDSGGVRGAAWLWDDADGRMR